MIFDQLGRHAAIAADLLQQAAGRLVSHCGNCCCDAAKRTEKRKKAWSRGTGADMACGRALAQREQRQRKQSGQTTRCSRRQECAQPGDPLQFAGIAAPVQSLEQPAPADPGARDGVHYCTGRDGVDALSTSWALSQRFRYLQLRAGPRRPGPTMDAAVGGVEVALLPWPELADEDAVGVDAPQPEDGEFARKEDAECKEDQELRLARLRELLKREAAAWAESAAEVRQASPTLDARCAAATVSQWSLARLASTHR